ncbi:MAG: DSD1 family PLP-dependent enzyme [Rhodospirillales bacterium]
MNTTTLQQFETPALLLDETRMQRNITRMRERLAGFRVGFRPHVKTCKCIEVTRRLQSDPLGPVTVSTLHEADYFARHGVKDIMYAVGIAPNKLAHVSALRRQGVKLSIILDSAESAAMVAAHARARNETFDVLIEIDADNHRAGVPPNAPELVAIGKLLAGPGAKLMGVMTHAGKSYDCRSDDEMRAMAEQERTAVVTAAARLREQGFACPMVSVGSTPTALFAENLDGVTEVRAGVYVFFDLVMAGLNVCKVDDIALSVLGTVIGHQLEKGWTLVDAGWMAMSRDRGTARQRVDQGYGLVCDVDGRPLGDLIVIDANQEHGIIAPRPGSTMRAPPLPIGSQVRILPNHACATAAQFGAYQVLGADNVPHASWQRFNGW